ncbi:retron St85 family effector protein [Rahnella variigena]|uniref:retron St85 family effector protein n=1 Tax=Rahnella variigena TaxID=574964 RepID=UPI002169027A|nr:retron St85 family effector protein [Rahnella variigena]
MSDATYDSDYLDALLMEWGELNVVNFSVHYIPPVVFVCGGPTLQIGASLRERVFRYIAAVNPRLASTLVMAEAFKDYFKSGAYSDLMQFEDDIANISTLVVIFLESAGSLVELGMFVNKASLNHRLLVFVPAEELAGDEQNDIPPRSSFIYLGPLESLRRVSNDSVCVYPWPNTSQMHYAEVEHIVNDLSNKLDTVQKTENFSISNSGHIAALILEIILLSEPIKISEIDWVLSCLDINETTAKISKSLYLLEVMKLIQSIEYSGSKYYYVLNTKLSKIKFGRTKKGRVKDSPNMRMAIIQSYVKLDGSQMDETAKKRRNVLSQITKLRGA